MSDQHEQRNKQLALFGVIVVEVIANPTIFGGIAYWLTRGKTYQSWAVFAGAMIGLSIGFYRIYLIQKRLNQDDQSSK